MDYDMYDEKWSRDKPLNLSDAVGFLESIPNDWQSITAHLHAPFDFLRKERVSPGIVYRITGPELGHNYNTYSIDYCPYLSRFPRDKEHGFCSHYENEGRDLKVGSIDGMLSRAAMPCGIFLDDAGRNTFSNDIKEKKELLIKFLSRGYSIGILEAVRGSYCKLIGRERREISNLNHTERFFLNNRDDENNLPFVILSWNSDVGDYETMKGFVKFMKDHGFTEQEE